HFTAAGGEAHEGHVAQVECGDDGGQVVGVVVHVVAVPRLAGAPVPAAVVGDDPVAVRGQEQHLGFPAVRVQRPAVAEGDHRAVLRAPVLVVQAHPVGGDDVVAVDAGGAGGGLQVGWRRRRGTGGAGVDGEGEQAGGEGAGDGVHGGSPGWSGGSRVRPGEAYFARACPTTGDVKCGIIDQEYFGGGSSGDTHDALPGRGPGVQRRGAVRDPCGGGR